MAGNVPPRESETHFHAVFKWAGGNRSLGFINTCKCSFWGLVSWEAPLLLGNWMNGGAGPFPGKMLGQQRARIVQGTGQKCSKHWKPSFLISSAG